MDVPHVRPTFFFRGVLRVPANLSNVKEVFSNRKNESQNSKKKKRLKRSQERMTLYNKEKQAQNLSRKTVQDFMNRHYERMERKEERENKKRNKRRKRR